ncbi:MAG: endonuclease domain-containing protein [Acidimicrobiia bacterium]
MARSLIDAAPMLRPKVLTRVLDDARRSGLVTTDDLRLRLRALRRRGRPGVSITESVLRSEGDAPAAGSVLERMFLELLTDWGLPLPLRQVKVPRVDGSYALLDFAYPEQRIAIELDGHGSHATRGERAADSQRQNDIALSGWTVLRFTYEQVRNEPEATVRVIRRALNR